MSHFLSVALPLWTAILPLYLMIALGFIAGRKLHVSGQAIAGMVIYLIVPVVFFGAVATTRFDPAYFFLPVVTFALSAGMSFAGYHIARRVCPDSRANLVGQAAGTGNTGYFGVPLFLAMQPESTLGVYILAMIGISVSEATVGYYLLARGNFTRREAVRRVLRLPLLYACAAGLLVNALGGLPETKMVTQTLQQFRGAYIILGMMMVGLGLSRMHKFELDGRFTGLVFVQRLLFWPLATVGLLALDRVTVGIFDPLAASVLITLSAVPLAANTVAFATQLDIHPEKAATAVLLSTVVAVGMVPVVQALTGSGN